MVVTNNQSTGFARSGPRNPDPEALLSSQPVAGPHRRDSGSRPGPQTVRKGSERSRSSETPQTPTQSHSFRRNHLLLFSLSSVYTGILDDSGCSRTLSSPSLRSAVLGPLFHRPSDSHSNPPGRRKSGTRSSSTGLRRSIGREDRRPSPSAPPPRSVSPHSRYGTPETSCPSELLGDTDLSKTSEGVNQGHDLPFVSSPTVGVGTPWK